MIRNVESKFGSIVTFSPSNCLISKSIENYGEWAFNEIELIKKLIGNDGNVVDVGAHIGFHSIAMSHAISRNQKVFAIEGNKETFKLLCQNTAHNPNIVTINKYLSNKRDKKYYETIEKDNLGASGLADIKDEAVDSKPIVSTSTLDDLSLENICLIKIDAEGFDSRIVRGARQLIETQKPIIIAEANCSENVHDLYSFLAREIGYHCYFFSFDPLNRRNYKGNQIDIFGPNKLECSLVFSPHEIEDISYYELKDINALQLENLYEIDKFKYDAFRKSQCTPSKTSTLLAIPFFKNEHLVSEMITSLASISDELKKCSIEILLINDSPRHEPLNHALDSADIEALDVPYRILKNKKNLGYLESANLAIDMARNSQQNLILLNSDATPSPNCITEMLNILELDEKIGFVAPRSNKCSISTLPVESIPKVGVQELHALISPKYNRYMFGPVSPGFMLLVRDKVLTQFGNFSKDFTPGYEEENDWQMRCGIAGWRSVLANRAYADHKSSQSFSTRARTLSLKHSNLIQQIHPFYQTLIDKYQSNNTFLSDKLIANSESKTLLISCPNMNDHHDGTSRHAKRIDSGFFANIRKKL